MTEKNEKVFDFKLSKKGLTLFDELLSKVSYSRDYAEVVAEWNEQIVEAKKFFEHD